MKTREQVRQKMEEIFKICIDTHATANAEYAKEQNAFANFDNDAAEIGIHRNQSWLVLTSKHWRGIVSYIRGFKSQREDIRGRIKDLIVYLVLLWAMLDDEEEGAFQTRILEAKQQTTGVCGHRVRGVGMADNLCTMEPGHSEDHFRTFEVVSHRD